MTIRLTAFAKYDRLAASTRQRLLQYVPSLNEAGIDVDYRPLLENDYVASLGAAARYPTRKLARAYARRLREIGMKPLGDVVWVYAELFPQLPAIFERILLTRRRPIIYDFDDAFFEIYDQHRSGLARVLLARKLEPLLRAASVCTCGNAYLQEYATKFCKNSLIVPTCVDTDVYRPGEQDRQAAPVVGWIGSPSTWPYMDPLLPLLEELVRLGRAKVRVIGAGLPAVSQKKLSWIDFMEWSELDEVAQLQRFDIGIMPLPNEPWARGKSGYKLIQYMACGLPAVASPVGINCEIVRDGCSGFLAKSLPEWRCALDNLIENRTLRARFGREARQRAVRDYSLQAYAPRVVEIIRSSAQRR